MKINKRTLPNKLVPPGKKILKLVNVPVRLLGTIEYLIDNSMKKVKYLQMQVSTFFFHELVIVLSFPVCRLMR